MKFQHPHEISSVTLKMEKAHSSKTCYPTQCNNREEYHMRNIHHESMETSKKIHIYRFLS